MRKALTQTSGRFQIGQQYPPSRFARLWHAGWRAAGLAFTLLALAPVQPSSAASCGTTVGGYVVAETWTAAQSPYCVTNDVFVLGLTIQSNVTVLFNGNYEFEVAGQLQVQGTPNAPVLFTPTTTNGWKGILFRDAVPGSYFNCAIIEGANQSGVRITNTPPAFTNCVIRGNTTLKNGGGICAKVTGQPLIIEGCLITNNLAGPYCSDTIYGGGICVGGPSVISYCTIVDNETRGYYGAGGGTAVGGGCTLRNCTIAGNVAGGCSSHTGDGVYMNGGAFEMLNCLIATNGNWTSGGAAGGLQMEGATTKVVNSVITGNARQGVAMGSSSSISLVNCTIVQNQYQGFHAGNGTGMITNCIVYFNYGGDQQLYNSTVVDCSNVQGGTQPGRGNISYSPALCPQNFALIQGSPCMDTGSPEAVFNDLCINATLCTPYSRGTARNDMGAYGGPGA